MTDISAVSSAIPTTTSTTSTGATTDAMADQLGADVFLQLLVAQLKYQDPTAPSDGTEFLAQTAQFTMVEKLSQLADNAEASAVVDRNLAAATMVGRQVEFLRADGSTGSGTVETARLGSAGPVLTVAGEEVPFETVSAVVATEPPAPPQPVEDVEHDVTRTGPVPPHPDRPHSGRPDPTNPRDH